MSREYDREVNDVPLQLSGMLTGFCLVQGEGMIGAYPFYFCARWQEWNFSIAETSGVDAVDMQSFVNGEQYGFLATGSTSGLYDAGWMPLAEAEEIIKECCRRYQALRSK